MSENTNQEIFEEGTSFTKVALSNAAEELMNGGLPNIALLASRDPAPHHGFGPGAAVGVRVHSMDGELVESIDIDEESDETFEDRLAELEDDGYSRATPVAVVPFVPNKNVWYMSIGMGSRVMNTKFVTIIIDAWHSELSKTNGLPPSQCEDREESLNAITLFFGEDEKLNGVYSEFRPYARDKNGAPVFDEGKFKSSMRDGLQDARGFMIEKILAYRGTPIEEE